MKITNKFGLPEPFVALASTSFYSKGKADYSVTEIISPPRIQRLRQRHYAKLESDVSDMIWAFFGSLSHHFLEQHKIKNHINEQRLFVEVDGVTLSGAIDLQKETEGTVHITDYKFTSAWALMNDKPEWEAQQNIYAWLVNNVKGKPVIGVQICALIRDWSRREASVKADYPQAPIQVIDLPQWDLERTEAYIKERINLHMDSKVQDDWGEDLPLCSAEERWVRGDSWAVMREGKKRASKVCETEEEAKEVMASIPEKEKPYIEKRPGEAIRCTGDFCGVSKWCNQYQESLKNQG
jgi:hypothetical protein